jgi:outer membrane protein TolC
MSRAFQAGLTTVAAVAAVAVCLSGCTGLDQYLHNGFKVGPNYCRPAAPVAEHWIDAADTRPESEDLSQWWTVFKDPVLDRLIACAYHQNLSLREAGFRVLAARAQRGIAVGGLFPGGTPGPAGLPQRFGAQDAFGIYSRNGQGGTFFDQWNFSFALGWELDFWGRFRRAVAAADAQLDASVEDYDQVLVTLLADVATNYVTIRTAEARIRYLNENVALQEPVFKFWSDRTRQSFGTNPKVSRDQTEGLLRQTEAQIPQLEIDLRQANDRLCILLGIPPVELRTALDFWRTADQDKEQQVRPLQEDVRRAKEELKNLEQDQENAQKSRDPAKTQEMRMKEDERPMLRVGIYADEIEKRIEMKKREIEELLLRIVAVYIPTAPKGQEVAVGIPAQLLSRRPDVRRAERQGAAQAEQIGIAESEFYPHISITGALGWQAAKFSGLFTPEALSADVGPRFDWNLLHYGRIINNVRVADAQFQQAVLVYQNTVLQANEEVEDGLASFSRLQERVKLLVKGVRALDEAADYMRLQKEAGKIDVTQFTVIAQSLVQQEDLLAQAYGQATLGLIQVYRALGGGWQIRLEAPVPVALPPVEPPERVESPPPNDAARPEQVPAPQAAPAPSQDEAASHGDAQTGVYLSEIGARDGAVIFAAEPKSPPPGQNPGF